MFNFHDKFLDKEKYRRKLTNYEHLFMFGPITCVLSYSPHKAAILLSLLLSDDFTVALATTTSTMCERDSVSQPWSNLEPLSNTRRLWENQYSSKVCCASKIMVVTAYTGANKEPYSLKGQLM